MPAYPRYVFRTKAFVSVLSGFVLADSGLTQEAAGQSAPRIRAVGQAPGLESFAVPPRTPDELIRAIDYLVRVGLEKQAVDLARKLSAIDADDDTLDAMRTSYGSGKLLALQSTNEPNLNAAMSRFVDKLNAASKRVANDPDRIARLIDQLSATVEERDIAAERLARLGPATIGPFIRELSAPDISPEKRADLQFALNRLESSAVPGLVGSLRHPDESVRSAMLEALGRIGDARALPWVVFEAVRPRGAKPAAEKAAIALNGGSALNDPVRYLVSESARYLDRDVYFGDPLVEAWFWDVRDNSLKSLTLPAESARGAIGYRLGRMALELDPANEAAQTLMVSMLLDEESRRLGAAFPDEDPLGAWPMSLASGPRTLGYVLKRALITGRHENVAILSTQALGKVSKRSDLAASNGRSHILVEALDSPDRRVQFEAAKALSDLAPDRIFAGSSRVVPTMARFLRSNPVAPRAVVINDNVGKGSEWVSHLRAMGYDAVLEISSNHAFEEIVARADVELVLVSTFLDPAGWALHETVANFKADSRTAGIPLIVVGPLDARSRLSTLLGSGSNLGFMVDPANEAWAKRQIEAQLARMDRQELTADERRKFADEAARILGRIAASGDASIFSTAVKSLEPVLKARLTKPAEDATEPAESMDFDSLMNTVLSDSGDEKERIKLAGLIADAIRKSEFTPSPEQRTKLQEAFLKKENDEDHALEAALGQLIGLTDPNVEEISRFFSTYAPGANFYETAKRSGATNQP